MIQRYLEWVINKRKLVLGLTLLAVLLAASQVSRLHLEIDPAKVLPQSHPYVQTHDMLEQVFGEKYAMVITLTAQQGDVFQPTIIAKVKAISDGIVATPYVVRHNLLSLTSPRAKVIASEGDGLRVIQLAQASRSDIDANPVFDGLVLSKDRKTTAIIALFDKGPLGYWQVLKAVNPLIDAQRDNSVSIHVGGHAQVLGTIELFSERMLFFVPLAILIIGLIHFEAFRTIQGLILPLITANLALIFGLGVMGLTGTPLDVFNATTPILILAVAAGHAVQILKRYYEEYDRLMRGGEILAESANRQAIIVSLVRIGPFMLAAGLIAALGFLSLMVFDISTVRTFGLFTGIGILSAVLLEFTFIPALRASLAAPRMMEQRASIWDKMISKFDRVSRHGRAVQIVACMLIVLALTALPKVMVENSNKSNMASDLQIRIDDDFINQRMAGSQILYFIVDSGRVDGILTPENLRSIKQIQAFLAKQPLVGKSVAITDFLSRMHTVMSDGKNGLPETGDLASQYLLLYSMSADPTDFDSYIDAEHRRANIKVFIKDDSSIQVESLIQATLAEASRLMPGVSVRVGGGVAEAAALNEVLVRDKIYNIAQISVVVFLLSALLFRSWLAGVYVLLPVFFAILMNFGILGVFGIPLSVPTSVISAMAVGIGADYAIYLLSRVREEARTRSIDEAVSIAMRSAGLACVYVATAITAGYGLLVFSFGFRVHQYLGLLISSAMIVSAIAALTLVPALLRQYKPAFVFGVRK